MNTAILKSWGVLLLVIAGQASALELHQPEEPLAWKTEPCARTSDEASMEVVPPQAADPVKYRFMCTTDHAYSSNWQDSTAFTAKDLKPETAYTFIAYAGVYGQQHGLPSKPITVTTQKVEGPGNTAMIDEAIRNGTLEYIPIMINGDKDNRINLSLANRWEKGQGGTYSNPGMRDEFLDDCRFFLKAFDPNDPEAKFPYPEYKNFFNFYAMWWPDVPPMSAAEGETTITRDEYSQIRDRHFLPWQRPDHGWASQLAMYNTSNGGGNATLDTNRRTGDAMIVGNAIQGIIHEFSHTAPRCPDEYTSGGMWGYGGEGSTSTSDHRRNSCRWRAWIDKDTPVPTPYSEKHLGKVGLFEGALHRMGHVYRPTARGCLMGAGSGGGGRVNAFCVVCRQSSIMHFYEWVDAIDERSPSMDEITIPGPCRMNFSVKRVHPVPDTQKTIWRLNGKIIARNTDHLEVEFTTLDLYTLEFSLVDETDYIRPDPPFAEYPHASTTWTILNPKSTANSSQLALNISTIEPVFKGVDNGSIRVSATGGTSPYTFLWADDIEGEEYTGLAPGTYSVTVVDSEYRNQTRTIGLTPDKQIDPRIVSDYDGEIWTIHCPAAEEEIIEVKWRTGETSATIQSKSHGRITCQLRDKSGCITTQTLELKRPGKPLKVSSNKTLASSGGENNGYVELKTEGGRTPIQFIWSDGIVTQQPERHYLHPGKYSVTVRDANGTQRNHSFTIASEPVFHVNGLQLEQESGDLVRIVNPDDAMEYLWFDKDIPGWLPRFPMGIYTGSFTKPNGTVCYAEAFVIQIKGGYYIKMPERKLPSHHQNNLGYWAHVMIYENGREEDARLLSLGLTKTENGYTMANLDRCEEKGWTGTVIDGLMTGTDTVNGGGTFEMRFDSRPEQVDAPVAIGTNCRIPEPGSYFIAARKKSNGALSLNRQGFTFGKKPASPAIPIDQKTISSANLITWLDASDMDGDGATDNLFEVPFRRGAIMGWQGKANNVNLGGFVFYQPNSLNGHAVASWETIWLQGLEDQPRSYQTIIMVRREHDFSVPGKAPWEKLNSLIGGGKYGEQLFSGEAAESLKNSRVFINSELVDPSTSRMPTDFYIATYEFEKPVNNVLGSTEGNWEGAIAEVMIFDGKLSDADRKGIEEHLRRKWLSSIDL